MRDTTMRVIGIRQTPMFVLAGVLSCLALASRPNTATALPTSTLTVTVNCGAGESIDTALTRGAEGQRLMVLVQGTCNENVSITRDDVTLQGDPSIGGGVNGPDAVTNTIDVSGRRVTIDSLLVTGGLNGIRAIGTGGLMIRNATVQNTGRTGVVLVQGASGTVDGCTIQNNPRDGIAIDSSASAFVVNSLIAQNGRNGVVISDGASARVGLSAAPAPAGNTITQNGGSGINISLGSAAFIADNAITFNGTDPASGVNRFGIVLSNATARLIGLNSITDNASAGLSIASASVRIGDPSFGFSAANTIARNHAILPINGGGINAFLGSQLQIQDATISDNSGAGIFASVGSNLQLQNSTISGNTSGATAGFGVFLGIQSSAQLVGNTIQKNTVDGVRLAFGSALFLLPPVTTVIGNGGFGLQCTDGESSVVNTGLLSLSGNGLGGVSGTCTGF